MKRILCTLTLIAIAVTQSAQAMQRRRKLSPQEWLNQELIRSLDEYDPCTHILERITRVRGSDEEGWTALHHAVCGDMTTLIQPLVEKNADINALDNEGETPLLMAASVKNPGMLKMLLECNPDITIKHGQSDLYDVIVLPHAGSAQEQEKIKLMVEHLKAHVARIAPEHCAKKRAEFRKEAEPLLITRMSSPLVNIIADYYADYPLSDKIALPLEQPAKKECL